MWMSRPNWAAAEARKCLCGRGSMCGMRQDTCLRVRVISLGVKVSVLCMRVNLFRKPLRRHLTNSSRNRRYGNTKLYHL